MNVSVFAVQCMLKCQHVIICCLNFLQSSLTTSSITIGSWYTEKTRRTCLPTLAIPSYKPLNQLPSEWEYNPCNSLPPQAEVKKKKLIRTMDGVPRTGERQQNRAQKKEPKWTPYEPHFMQQSISSDEGVGQNKFQIGFKGKRKKKTSRHECYYLI